MAAAERATGIDAPQAIHPAFFRIAAHLAGGLERVVPLPSRYSAEGRRALAGATYWGDNSKAKRELGRFHRPVEGGLAATLRDEMRALGIDAAGERD